MRLRAAWLLPLLSISAMPRMLESQQYRLRLESQFQSVSFRGVSLDSVLVSEVVIAPGGGQETVDGFAVRCGIAGPFCYFFRPGAIQSARPAMLSAGATVWGLGLTGLSLRVDARTLMNLGNGESWPGTSPAFQLLEGYAEYSIERYTGRLGRQVYTSRLGFTGFDGARANVRLASGRLEADGYIGWGLGRGSALPVTSEALNPLDDFQPRQRQIVAGAGLGWNHRFGSLRLDYQREVDPRSDYFVSERAAAAGSLRLPARLNLDLGAEYDIAMAAWGSADATLRYSRRTLSISTGFMRYRPHFELWTIWGAFSPVGYSAINGSVAFTPLTGVSVSVDHDTELSPGGSFTSLSGMASYQPRPSLTLSLNGGRLNRPLEFRFDEATLHFVGAEAEWRSSERWRGALAATRFFEKRDRPDAAAFDWNQTRIVARVSVFLGWVSEQAALPPAVPTRAPAAPR